MRRSFARLVRSFAALCLFAALAAGIGFAQVAQILETYAASLTTYKPSGNTLIQGVRPHQLQRGVNLDGSTRAGPFFPMALTGNPFENAWRGQQFDGSLRLDLGTYAPSDVDIALPSEGVSWVVGRTYNSRQTNSGGSGIDSNAYQGRNWFQTSQPEILLYDDEDNTKDMVYLVYGADRYVEFLRADEDSNQYKAKNGAAGCFTFVSGTPDTWVYTDQHGYEWTFLGFDTTSHLHDGQFWKVADPDGNVAFVGSTASASSAISAGYDGAGRITVAYDASERRYTYSYATYDSVVRLTEVKAETKTNPTWADPGTVTTVAKVNYTYYVSTDTDIANGSNGDLKEVTVTEYLDDTGVALTKKKYYRYWKGSWDDDPVNPGCTGEVRMVLDFEGTRAFDWLDTNFDEDFLGAAYDDLKPYASAYFEYDSGRKVVSAWTNGQCGCGGGSGSGAFAYTYETNPLYADDSGYDIEWAKRTVVAEPDGSFETRYFDETGQGLTVVKSDIDPADAEAEYWVTKVIRNSAGCVTDIHTPQNVYTYTHNDGDPDGTVVTYENANGASSLTTHFVRVPSGNMTGFVADRLWYKGDWVDTYAWYERSYTWTSFSKAITDVAVVRPLVASDRAYSTAVTSGTSGSYLTSYTPVAYSSTLAIETLTTTNPTVDADNNGSESATSTAKHFRLDGNLDYEKDEAGIINYHDYSGGLQTTHIADADTGDLSEPTGFTSSGVELDKETTITYTAQGKVAASTPPENVNKTYRSRLLDQRLVVLQYADYDGEFFYGPVRYTVYNQAGKVVVEGLVALTDNQTDDATTAHVNEGDADPITAADLGTVVRMTTHLYNEAGTRLEETRAYFDVPASGVGDADDNYDPTLHGYDDAGQQWRVKEAHGTIHRTVHDAIGRVAERWIGTNDNNFAGGESSGDDDMVKVEALVYDAGHTGYNSLLTSRTLYVEDSSSGERVTLYEYDVRGNLLLQTNSTAPHEFHKYDNMRRRIATGLFSSTANIVLSTDNPTSETSNRLALTQTFFDEKGQVWTTQRHQIDDADGSNDDNLQTLNWYDPTGQLIKTDGPELRKTTYDRLGRLTDEYVLSKDDDEVGTTQGYTDASSVTGDIVLEERQQRYDPTTGMVMLGARIDRLHSDLSNGTTGKLDTNADNDAFMLTAANITGRPQISAFWYDRTERLIDRVEFGTFNGDDFDRNDEAFDDAPARSDTALRTTIGYTGDGMASGTTDPRGTLTFRYYDDLGRVLAEARNYDIGVNSGAPYGTDQNVTVEYVYENGLRTSLTAVMPSGGGSDQVTTYTYGTVKGASAGDSKIGTGHLLKKITYPDSQGSTDVVAFAYNAQEQEVWKKDQYHSGTSQAGGNVIETDYDTSGRVTQKRVSTLASGFDGAIRRIQTGYDGLGRTSTIVQYDDPDVGEGYAKDGIKFTYTDWGTIEQYEEDRDTAVSGGGNQYATSYVWEKATGGRNTLRKTTATLPGGRAITYQYRASSNLNDGDSSRVTAVIDDVATLCWYDYNGVGQVVRQKYNQASVMWQQYTSTVGSYPDLDRFNRVVASRWTKDLATDKDFYSVALTYDRNSNITSADDSVHAGFDVKYTMDNVDRLTQAEEGTLSGGSISSKTRDEQWTLNHTGNWDENKVNLNGDADFTDSGELDEDRTHDVVNQLNARDTDDNGSDNYTLTYDGPGDLTDDGKDYEYEYDAFLRLRKVKNTSNQNLVAEFRYNGLGHRIAVHEDTEPDGDVDANDKWYYDAYDERWRQVARFRESDSSPKEDFVPHQAGLDGNAGSSYIDLVICRNKDANTAWTSASDGTLEERLFHCQNGRADSSALVTSSGTMKEWVKHSAYGLPFGLPGGDSDSDGDCDSADVSQVHTWWFTTSTYDVRGDIDLDGDVDATDESTIDGSYEGITTGRAILTAPGVGNRRALAGYDLDAIAGNSLHVRKRVLHCRLGRWLQREALAYQFDPYLYAYLSDRPLVFTDPSGNTAACPGLQSPDGPPSNACTSQHPSPLSGTCMNYGCTSPATCKYKGGSCGCSGGGGGGGGSSNCFDCSHSMPSTAADCSYYNSMIYEQTYCIPITNLPGWPGYPHCALCITGHFYPSCICYNTPNSDFSNCVRGCIRCVAENDPNHDVNEADHQRCFSSCLACHSSGWKELDDIAAVIKKCAVDWSSELVCD